MHAKAATCRYHTYPGGNYTTGQEQEEADPDGNGAEENFAERTKMMIMMIITCVALVACLIPFVRIRFSRRVCSYPKQQKGHRGERRRGRRAKHKQEF